MKIYFSFITLSVVIRSYFSKAFILLLALIADITYHSKAQTKDLDYFVAQAIQNSPLLKENANNILLNKIDSIRIRAVYRPQVNGMANNYVAPVVKGYGYDEVITNLRNFSEQVGASKLFVGRRNLQIQFNGIQLINDSLVTTGKIVEQDLKRTIIAAYIAAYGSWRQLFYNQEVYDLLTKEDVILKKLTQASTYRQTDYLTFLVTLQQQHLAVTQSRVQYQANFATLNLLAGLNDTSLVPLDSPRIAMEQLPELAGSIFYRKFTIDSLLLKNAGQQLDYSYRPKLTATTDAGYVSSLMLTPYKNFGASVGLILNVPIYDGNQRRLQHRKLDILERTRQGYRDFYATQYTQQLALLTQQLNYVQQVIGETNEQLRNVRTLIQVNQRLLATGDVRIADYVIAISNYLNAQSITTQNLVNQLQIITQINYYNRR